MLRGDAVIRVSEKALKYIAEHGGSVYVYEIRRVGMCCGRINLGPSVRLGIPPNLAAFELQAEASICLYIPKDFCSPFDLTLEVNSFFGVFKTLSLEGWKII